MFIASRPLQRLSLDSVELAIRQPLPASSISLAEDNEDEEITDTSESMGRNGIFLAPVDRGFGAWSFLTAAFFVEAIVWGFPTAFGVFLAFYLNDPLFSAQKDASSLLPLIGPLSSGIMYCSGLLIYLVTARYPYLRRPSMWLGTFICWASLFGASYATTVKELVILQGVLYAVGGSLLYHPCLSYMSEWFVVRRGLANGVIFAGTGVGGLVLPLILSPLLKKFGPFKTLRILSIAIICMLVPILPFIKGRLPESRVHGPAARATDRSWMKNRIFWLVLVANAVQAFAYFIPVVWLPTFASELHISDTGSSLTIALFNGASVLGRLGMGALSDKFDPWLLALSSFLTTSLATFVLWGVLSHNLAGLLAYGIAYGSLAGGWTSLWTAFVRPVAKDDPTLSTHIFGVLLLIRGLGNVLSTPISTSLSHVHASSTMRGHTGFDVAGGRFEKMIVYVGTCFAGAAIVATLGWSMERSRVHRS